jgi:hypothetical protein
MYSNMGLLASPAMPGLLILLSLGWLCGQSSASYASTAPKVCIFGADSNFMHVLNLGQHVECFPSSCSQLTF